MNQIIGKDLLASALLEAQESLEPLSNRGWGGEIGHNEVEQIINAGREALTKVGLVLSRLNYKFEEREISPRSPSEQSLSYEKILVSNYELVHATSGRSIPYTIELPVQQADTESYLDRSMAVLIRGLLLPAFETCSGAKRIQG